MTFGVAVDTREVPRANVSKTTSEDVSIDPKPTPAPEPVVAFSDVPEDKRGPRIQTMQPQILIEVPSLNVSLLPAVVRTELQRLEEKLLNGDITVKGYNFTKAELLKPYETLAQLQQVADEGGAKVQRKPYKDLEGEEPKQKAESIVQQNHNANKDAAVKEPPVTPLVPVHIDDVHKELETSKPPVKDAIQRPLTFKLLNHISKIRSAESQNDPTNAAGGGGAPVGRKLQHFTSSDRGFLPWEKRKYFHGLLEVNRAHDLHCVHLKSCILYFLRHHVLCVASTGRGTSEEGADVRDRWRRHRPEAAGHFCRIPSLRQQVAQQPVRLHVPQSPRPHASHGRPAHHAGDAGHVRLVPFLSLSFP